MKSENKKLFSALKAIIAVFFSILIIVLSLTFASLFEKKNCSEPTLQKEENEKEISIREIDFVEAFMNDNILKEFYKPFIVSGTVAGIHTERIVFADITQDGKEDAIVPVASGGTAGDTAYAVFTIEDEKVKKIMFRKDKDRLILETEDGYLIEKTPVIKTDEANCCPSSYTYKYYKYNIEEEKMVLEKIEQRTKDGILEKSEEVEDNLGCQEISEFQDYSWFKDLTELYKEKFLIEIFQANISEESEYSISSDQAFLIDNNLIFIPNHTEWGCQYILNYNIEENELYIPIGTPNEKRVILGGLYFSACASKITNIENDYVEFEGWMGDGPCYSEDYGRYYFKENKIEIYKGCSRCNIDNEELCNEYCSTWGECFTEKTLTFTDKNLGFSFKYPSDNLLKKCASKECFGEANYYIESNEQERLYFGAYKKENELETKEYLESVYDFDNLLFDEYKNKYGVDILIPLEKQTDEYYDKFGELGSGIRYNHFIAGNKDITIYFFHDQGFGNNTEAIELAKDTLQFIK